MCQGGWAAVGEDSERGRLHLHCGREMEVSRGEVNEGGR